MSTQADSTSPEDAGTSKRLVRILVLIGIGIPILIEAATLVRLIGGHLGGGDGHRGHIARYGSGDGDR